MIARFKIPPGLFQQVRANFKLPARSRQIGRGIIRDPAEFGLRFGQRQQHLNPAFYYRFLVKQSAQIGRAP